mgnify:CR=1 FL=1
MRASEAKFLDFIKKSPQFVIPIYQRTYSWSEKECQQLWDDIIRTGENDLVTAHFVGSIVYIEEGIYQVTGHTPLLVIDGQQRLTTLSLFLAALAENLENHPENGREPIDGFSPRKLRNYYLVNPEEEGERRYKLILSQTDRDSLIAVIEGREFSKDVSFRIEENYKFFKRMISGYGGDIASICKGVAKLVIVDIALNRDQDNPQLIFESMNSTGLELTQADLIRNFILMDLEPSLQTRLYKEYWRPMELDFVEKAHGTHFDSFMRHYLTVKTGDIPRVGEIYEAFKAYSRLPEVEMAGVEALVGDVQRFARHYCAMALGAERDSQLSVAFHDLRELKVEVAYPFLLELYNDYTANLLPKEDFLTAVRLVEAYVFRRAVCSIPTNSLNKTFATFGKALKKDRYLESIQAHFILLPSYRRFPDDKEFIREFQVRDLYNFRSRSYWLRKLENHDRKELVKVNEYTIEHIMPQNENLSQDWKSSLGDDWERVHETWLHTLGNLTLTGYNSEYGNRPFVEKRDMPGGFRESPLKLNRGLGSLSEWTKEAIKNRAQQLSEWAVRVWQIPEIDAEILDAYRPRTEPKTSYSIEDHPYLASGSQMYGDTVPLLFQAFRREVLALDPVVTEEFLKLYVAYKAETNFVDVIPQAKLLLLSLNIPFTEVIDPEGNCTDVSNRGRWGNGDVEVGLASFDELPYVIGLVRQALERQMGNGDER